MFPAVTFHECQPTRPRWCPVRLEVEVTGTHLRFRTVRRGPWRTIPLSTILTADRRPVSQRAWPLAVRMSLDGTEAFITLSGQGVLLTLQDGRRLLIGTRQPEALIRAVQPSPFT